MKPTSLIILLIVLITIFACEKDPTSSKDDDTIKDIDGNVYTSVIIGDQEWMVENLIVSRYRNGDVIPNVTDKNEWTSLSNGAYGNFDNNASNAVKYGRLYNWYTVTDSRNIAPLGWHVPGDDEWQTLIDFLGGNSVAGGKMKESGNDNWKSPNSGATNESGFTALPGGFRYAGGSYAYNDYYSCFWSSTISGTYAHEYSLVNQNSIVYLSYREYRQGNSVRCIKD